MLAHGDYSNISNCRRNILVIFLGILFLSEPQTVFRGTKFEKTGVGGRLGLRVGLDGRGKSRFHWDSIPGPSLCRLRYIVYFLPYIKLSVLIERLEVV